MEYSFAHFRRQAVATDSRWIKTIKLELTCKNSQIPLAKRNDYGADMN